MKILLLGEYSNVHHTLGTALRRMGHDVTVVSDGDGWKNYPRDVDLKRKGLGALPTLNYIARLCRVLRHLRGYDVVQLINPIFVSLRADRILPIYKYLRRNNGGMFLGAFGMDYYWVKAGLDCHTFRYSDFNIGSVQRINDCDNQKWINDWFKGSKGILNRAIAADADGIVSGLYEYDAAYRPYFAQKLRFIPFPIDIAEIKTAKKAEKHSKVRFFIGIQRERNSYKGTDIMLRALKKVAAARPDECEMLIAEQVPFATYRRMMDNSDVVLDQLYSYTPAMNALLCMAKGLVVVGGGEEENYNILSERQLRPIVNVEPNEESVVRALNRLLDNKEQIPRLQRESIEYVRRHHESVKVANQYISFWREMCGK